MGSDSKTQTHESYGMVQVSRISCDPAVNLFGSSIKCRNLIALRIHRAKKQRDLNNDWYFSTEPLVEAHMSPTQFAEMITALNMGDGVPVTLTRFGGKFIEECPETNDRQLFDEEFKDKVADIMEDAAKLAGEAVGVLERKGALKVSERKKVASLIKRLVQEVQCNTPFVQRQFNRAMDKTVTSAKAEVEEFFNSAIQRLGTKALESDPVVIPPKIEISGIDNDVH